MYRGKSFQAYHVSDFRELLQIIFIQSDLFSHHCLKITPFPGLMSLQVVTPIAKFSSYCEGRLDLALCN